MPNITLGFRFKEFIMKIEVEKGDLSYANEMNMTLVFPDSFTASDFNMFLLFVILSKKIGLMIKLKFLFLLWRVFCQAKLKIKKDFMKIL